MKFPITIVPNFFSATQEILKIANELDYEERLTLHFVFRKIGYHTFPYVRCKLEDL